MAAADGAQRPWLNASLDVEERVKLLLQAMTLEECALQLDQPRIDEASDERIRSGVGSLILATSATAGNDAQPASSAGLVDRLQRIAIDETRLGVPILAARDIIHGHHTVFPIPLGQACGWDAPMVEAACRAAAVEASADGVRWTFSPMIDICRDPRWGRIAEGYGESAFLTGELGAAAVHGYQKRGDLAAPDAIAACAKHLAGYGAAEGGRDYDTAEISQPTLEDVYLPPFRAALVDAGCATVMPTFTAVGGLPAAASAELLTGVLRTRWGFDGVVVTDWNAVGELREHGIAHDGAHAAEQCLRAGSDIDMVSGLFLQHLPARAAADGGVEAALREATRRVLRLKFRLGLFEAPYAAARAAEAPPQRAPHRQLARTLAARCAVLLENKSSALPLAPDARLAVVGPLADATVELFGTWTLDGVPSEVTSLAAALCAAHKAAVEVVPAAHGASTQALGAALAGADVAIAVLGEGPEVSGEAHSLAEPRLPAEQVALLDRLVASPPAGGVVLVVIAGRPLALPAAADACAAVLWCCHPGTDGGLGLADVLTGAAEPGGRLAFTLPRHPGQIPLYHDHRPTGRPLGEYYGACDSSGALARGSGRHLDCQGSPRWPFGHGLSYTAFKIIDARVAPLAPDAADAGVLVHCRVANAGTERAGSAVVQVYVSQPVAELSQPVRRLAGFARAHLSPGEHAEVEVRLPAHALAYFHRDRVRRVDAGRLLVWIGLDCLCEGSVGPLEVQLPQPGTRAL